MAPPARDAYQVGWICALPIEAAAAKEMLDENFGNLDEQDGADTNSYTLGRVGKHYVVIACLPGGQYGTPPATTVAINMMRTFSRSMRIGLMVGIGGGIPSADHDVRLGDIVVSQPDGTCGGVLQYDMGKVVKGGKLQRDGFLNSPPRSLLTAVANMQKDAISDDPSYPEYIRMAIQRNARTKNNFGRPDASTDRLFQIKHDHLLTAATCEACPSEWEETRTAREETNPQIHYGIIASGNAVMKHGATRERLRRETGALCFEMEAAGLMQDFPCIVVRGICDYADSHKNKQWQGYAALAAASYAKELLSYVPVARVSEEKLVTEICSNIVKEVSEINKGMERAFHQREGHHLENMQRALTKEKQECHQAFKIFSYEQFKNINPDRAEGTCRWILENSQYLAWLKSSHNDLLWISADPGCGKSVLAKSLVDNDLKMSTSVSVCYFFFKDNDEQNNLSTALCSVLHQLFGMQPDLLRHALPSWQRNGTKVQHEVDELWRILMAAMSDSASYNTMCVFDALDECRPTDQALLIEKLERFYAQTHSSTRQSWLKFLVTSRPYAEIQDGFRPATKLFPHIHICGEEDNDQIREEISLVVRMRVAELGESLRLPPETQQRLEQQLLQMERRTYLWLYLAMEDIRTMFQNSLQPEGEAIELIPTSVNDAYNKVLNRVPSNKVSDVKMILQIIVGARRPLTIEEIAMAIGVAKSSGSQTAATAGLNPAGLDKKIRHLCGLFVFINNSRVYLIHQTAREFLLNRSSRYDDGGWSFKQDDIEELMSEICINYLLLDDIDGGPRQSNRNVSSLLQYSAEYWPDHVRGMPLLAESKAETRLDQLYDVTSARFALWYPIFWKSVMEIRGIPQMNAIRLAAFNGHKNVLRRLILRNGSKINQSDEHGANALYRASQRGHAEVVRILLDSGADINVQGGEYGYGNALQVASLEGHATVVQVLLDEGADINAQGELDSNALQAASYGGHVEIVQILLEKGAHINAQGEPDSNALQAASLGGHLEVVQILLEKGADINAQGGQHGNALQAASKRHFEIAQMLLDEGEDVDASGGRPVKLVKLNEDNADRG
ncbi:hypothetical protein H633G_10085 [Metarhizium anisopliae BRIP 53284]|nr:hypothetical protein H633G_10085 [Metarhizium anisopliae BRIP 53284]